MSCWERTRPVSPARFLWSRGGCYPATNVPRNLYLNSERTASRHRWFVQVIFCLAVPLYLNLSYTFKPFFNPGATFNHTVLEDHPTWIRKYRLESVFDRQKLQGSAQYAGIIHQCGTYPALVAPSLVKINKYYNVAYRYCFRPTLESWVSLTNQYYQYDRPRVLNRQYVLVNLLR